MHNIKLSLVSSYPLLPNPVRTDVIIWITQIPQANDSGNSKNAIYVIEEISIVGIGSTRGILSPAHAPPKATFRLKRPEKIE